MTSDSSLRRTFSIALVLVAVSTVFLDYWAYSQAYHATPDIWSSTLSGLSAAPQQYRIGVLKAGDFLVHHAHLGMRHALALFDFIALLVAAFALRSLLLRSTAWRAATLTARALSAALFVALLQYSLWWLIWYQRPETLSIAALLAASLWLSTFRLRPGNAGALLNALALITIGALLGTIRADVGFTFNLGIAAACLLPFARGQHFALPRLTQSTVSFLAAAAAAAVQLYIMRVVYPHAGYGDTPMFQLLLNYKDHIRIVPFVLFVTPAIWLAVQLFKRRFRPTPPQAGLLIGTAFFVCLWVVLGKIDEVRIFMPFAFAITPSIAEAAIQRFEPSAKSLHV